MIFGRYIWLPMLKFNRLGISFQVYTTWYNHTEKIRQGFPVFILTLYWWPVRIRRHR